MSLGITRSHESVITRAPALVRDQVADFLRSQITSGALAPGAPLVERAICEATTASRATVREALRQLESDGLVVSEVGRGTLVATLTRKEALDIYAVRAKLEGFACRLFAEHANDQQLEELESSVSALQETLGDPVAMTQAKSRFYDTLFEGCGNAELKRLVGGLRARITLLRVNSLSVAGRPQASITEIKGIVEAIRQGNGDLAEQLCIQHIDTAAETALTAPGAHYRE